MFKILYLFTIFSLVHSIDRYFVTNPVRNTTFNVGNAATVTWRIQETIESNAPNINVDLIAGTIQNAQWVASICKDIPASSTSCSWPAVPNFLPTLPNGYGIQINYKVGGMDKFSYSDRFQIIGTFTGTLDNLPKQPAPEACIANCPSGDIINENPSLNASPGSKPVNKFADPRFASGTDSLFNFLSWTTSLVVSFVSSLLL